jgi:hypothetical protein
MEVHFQLHILVMEPLEKMAEHDLGRQQQKKKFDFLILQFFKFKCCVLFSLVETKYEVLSERPSKNFSI